MFHRTLAWYILFGLNLILILEWGWLRVEWICYRVLLFCLLVFLVLVTRIWGRGRGKRRVGGCVCGGRHWWREDEAEKIWCHQRRSFSLTLSLTLSRRRRWMWRKKVLPPEVISDRADWWLLGGGRDFMWMTCNTKIDLTIRNHDF